MRPSLHPRGRSGAPGRLSLLAGSGMLLLASAGWATDDPPAEILNNVTAGPHAYLADSAEVSVAVVPDCRFALNVGVNHSATPASDTTKSVEARIRVDVTPRVSLSPVYSAFNGDRAVVYAIPPVLAGASLAERLNPEVDSVGQADERQQSRSFGGTVGIKVLDGGTDDDHPWLPMLRADLGWANETLSLPLFLQNAFSKEWQRVGYQRNVDQAYTATVETEIRSTTLTLGYTRHHYAGVLLLSGSPTGQETLLVEQVSKSIHASTGSPLTGLSQHDFNASMYQQLPWKFGATLSYSYTKLAPDPENPSADNLARTTEVEASWHGLSWLEARLGLSWTLEAGDTSRYVTGGASVYF